MAHLEVIENYYFNFGFLVLKISYFLKRLLKTNDTFQVVIPPTIEDTESSQDQANINQLFCLSFTVPTQIISKSYLIHQNDNDYSQRQSQAVPEGGSVKLSCKARGFPQ